MRHGYVSSIHIPRTYTNNAYWNQAQKVNHSMGRIIRKYEILGLGKELHFPYPSIMFPKMPRKIISMVCYFLRYDNDYIIDYIVIGFLTALSSTKKSFIRFHFNQYLVDCWVCVILFP